MRWVARGVAPATLSLPVTAPTGGSAPTSLSVAPTDPTQPGPDNDGLNSNYRYTVADQIYRPDNALWCTQDGAALRCGRR
jgi:hypothetical protein